MKIKMMSTEELKFHPENHNYFSDMEDELWQIFLEDIRQNGIREPLTASAETLYVVKGNERLKAAIEVGIKELPVILQEYEDPDDEIDDLIRDNVLRKNVDIFSKFKLIERLRQRIPGRKRGPKKIDDIAPQLETSPLPPTEQIAQMLNESHDTVAIANVFNSLAPEVQESMKEWFYSQDKIPTKKELTKEIKLRKKAETQLEDLWKEMEARDAQIEELSGKLVQSGDAKQIDVETKKAADKLASLKKSQNSLVEEIGGLRILSSTLIRSREFFSAELLQLPALLGSTNDSSKELMKPEVKSFITLVDEWREKFQEVFGL
jgi:ParB family chromosome partitioning protein